MVSITESWLRDKPIAHRGLHNSKFPENSIGAFNNALDKGYPIEIDVQITKDKVLYVFHDYNTYRMTGMDEDIRKINSKQVNSFRLKDTEFTIPTLDEVLELVNGKVPVLIDIKSKSAPGHIENLLIKKLDSYSGSVAIQSFNTFSLRYIKKKAPNLIVGQLAGNKIHKNATRLQSWILKDCKVSKIIRPDFLSYNIEDLPNKSIEKYRKKGMTVIGWTVRNTEDRKKGSIYCDNYVFD
ncbi:MAG: glycerophosphodiester phosphodiesterase family protein [Anaerovoracaceae bacterium]